MENGINLELSDDKRKVRVRTASGKILSCKPVLWKHLDDYIELAILLTKEFFKCNGALASFFRLQNSVVWDLIDKVCAITPAVGTAEKLKRTDLEALSLDELAQLFVTATETKDEEGWLSPEDNRLKPSMLSVINSVDFFEVLRIAVERRKAEQEEMKKQAPLTEELNLKTMEVETQSTPIAEPQTV